MELDQKRGNLSDVVRRIKSHTNENIKSVLLFFSSDKPLKSKKNSKREEITTIEEFNTNPNFRGIIETDCEATLPPGFEHASSEFLITPKFYFCKWCS